MSRGHRPPPLSAPTVAAAYLEYAKEHRGLSASSLRQHRKAVKDLVRFLAERDLGLADLQVVHLDAYVHGHAGRGLSKSYLSSKVVGIRGFLRYLFAEGILQEDLSEFVARPLIYRDATVPPHFTWDELERLIGSVKGDDPISLRDRAMLALLCSYGLRGDEVAQLSLDDIDWKHQVLHIRSRKSNRPLTLPLVPLVAATVAAYLRRGRPSGLGHRRLLVMVNGTPYRNGNAVTTRLNTLVVAAGLAGGRGCHAIRRTVGTRLVEQGRGIGEVAQVLGHQRISSTRVYLRISMTLLRDVADNYGELL